jgi:hypothetical protein
VKATTIGLLLTGRHHTRDQDTAQPRDEIAVEARVIGALYGDSSARRQAYDTHACPGQVLQSAAVAGPAGPRRQGSVTLDGGCA